MSSGLDTATRRQVRKAFGGTAMEVIEAHEQGLRAHAQTLQQHESKLEWGRVNILATFNRIAEERAHVDAFIDRTFWQRLNWLLRGK